MQRGLIDHWAGEKRISVLFERDGQAFEPVGPLDVQLALYPDLVDCWFTWVRFWVEFVSHTSVPSAAGHDSPYRLFTVQG